MHKTRSQSIFAQCVIGPSGRIKQRIIGFMQRRKMSSGDWLSGRVSCGAEVMYRSIVNCSRASVVLPLRMHLDSILVITQSMLYTLQTQLTTLWFSKHLDNSCTHPQQYNMLQSR